MQTNYLCFSDAMAAVKRHNETTVFCFGRAARADNHTQRSYWLSNHMLNVDWRENALADAVAWASIGGEG